jgi:FMN phosphatase YigB (HAD superfamily)
VTAASDLVFLLDVDDTLIDNDRFADDLGARLEADFGAAQRRRYWDIFARLREAHGIADYLASLQEFRGGLDDEPKLLQMSEYLLEYPFANLLYPRALASIAHLASLGTPVVLSDGDVVYQPRKIQRSGIWAAVAGRVLIYVHKERSIASMQQRYPAAHYVMVDDKPHLLAAMKLVLGERLTTVFVRQGHYAHAADLQKITPTPDRSIETIAALGELRRSDFQENT